MKHLFQILFCLLVVFCLLPVRAQTLKETDLYLVRGDSKTFEFTTYGNVTSDELLFVVKKDTSIESPRLIQKQNTIAGGGVDEIETSYRAPFTKIKIKFYPVDTEDLLRNKYKFDLTRTDPDDSTDHTHLFIGNLNLQPTISTSLDGISVPLDGTRFYNVALDSSDKEPGIPIFRNSDNSLDYLSFEELKDSLQISGLKVILPDTVYMSASDTTEYNIYWNNFIYGNYKNYRFEVVCDSGRSFEQGWRWTPHTNATGIYIWIVRILDMEQDTLCLDTTYLKVSSRQMSLKKNYLMIGNSLTANNNTALQMYYMSGGGNEDVENGTFSSNISGWTENGTSPALSWEASGGGFTGTLHIIGDGAPDGVYQLVNINAGTTYRFQADLNVSSASGGALARAYIYGGKILMSKNYDIGNYHIDTLLTATSTTSSCYLWLIQAGAGTVDFYVDNISFAAIDSLVFIGTQDLGLAPTEGISGKRWIEFESYVGTPFVNEGGDVDLQNYLDTHSLDTPDLVTFNLGINDVINSNVTMSALDSRIETILTYADSLINNFLIVNPNMQIGICYPTPPAYSQDAFATNYSGQLWFYKYKLFRYWELLKLKYGKDGIKQNDKVTLIPLYLGLDTEHNMTTTATAYNRRNQNTYSRQTNAVHPAVSGYYQLSDFYYGWVVNK